MFDNKTLSWIHLQTTDSTNTWLREHAMMLSPHALTIVYADEQTNGRGQHGRHWFSPPGLNLYASLFFLLEKNFPLVSNLGQTLAMSCVHVLQGMGFSPQIKWPNDLFFGTKKVGGILAETITFEKHLAVIIGVGINVNLPKKMLEKIDQPATSLFIESGKECQIGAILLKIVNRFLVDLHTLQKDGFAALAHQMNECLAFRKQPILFKDGRRSFEAFCEGIDETGRLLLQLDNGAIEKAVAGSMTPLHKST